MNKYSEEACIIGTDTGGGADTRIGTECGCSMMVFVCLDHGECVRDFYAAH